MTVLVFKNCCFYYDLRNGLLVWGYLNFLRYTLLDGITAAICFTRLMFSMNSPADYPAPLSTAIVFLVACAIGLLNFFVNVLFLIGAHKRQICKLKVVIGISIFQVLMYISYLVVGNILFATNERIGEWLWYHVDPVTFFLTIQNPTLATIDILFQLYMLLLIRSYYFSIRDDTDQRAFVESFDCDGENFANRNGNISFVEIIQPKRTTDRY